MPTLPIPAADPGKPQNFWSRVLTYTPVIMTVVATLLAGLSNSELTQSQYHRTLAAQIQSKAGDQWGYVQAKKLRAVTLRNTIDLLYAGGTIGIFDPSALATNAAALPDLIESVDTTARKVMQTTSDPSRKAFLERFLQGAAARRAVAQQIQSDVGAALASGAPATQPAEPASAAPPAWQPEDPHVKAVTAAIAADQPENQIASLLTPLTDATLDAELAGAAAHARALDKFFAPATARNDHLEQALVQWLNLGAQFKDLASVVHNDPAHTTDAALAALDFAAGNLQHDPIGWHNDFAVTRLSDQAQRYDIEAHHNQSTAFLYEIEVRRDNQAAQRHQERSKRFFLGMVAAQAAVVVASLALAAKQRNLLWGFAAAVGMAAISFATYVYIYV